MKKRQLSRVETVALRKQWAGLEVGKIAQQLGIDKEATIFILQEAEVKLGEGYELMDLTTDGRRLLH